MDFSRNKKTPNINVSKEQDLNNFKDNLISGLPTLDKTPELSSKESLLLPIESLSTLAKKSHYMMVPIKEAKPKKKINSNIGEQNIIIGKKIKKRL